jgi:hypothetical protein
MLTGKTGNYYVTDKRQHRESIITSHIYAASHLAIFVTKGTIFKILNYPEYLIKMERI